MNRQDSPFQPDKSAIAASKYGIARTNLLLVILFTLINSVISLANGSFYFLFSASIPYYAASFSAAWAYSPEDIGLEPAADPTAILAIGAVIAAVLLVPYLLCWLFSKKHYGWMIAALVLFSLDSVWLLLNFHISLIMDILFHAYVLYYLITGVRYGLLSGRAAEAEAAGEPLPNGTLTLNPDGTIADMPATTANAEERADAESAPTEQPTIPNTPILRSADETGSEKVRVYIETVWDGHPIQYRRVGKSEELIVDGQVYAEMPHTRVNGAHMTATVAGMQLEAGAMSGSNIVTVNGKVVATTIRYI